MLRPFTGISKIEDTYGDIIELTTKEMPSSVMSESSFKNYGSLVTSKKNLKKLDKEDLKIINEMKKETNVKQTTLTNQSYIQPKFIDYLNEDQYKSPLSITLLSHKPERNFVEIMLKKYSKYIDTWIKSKDRGFYSIPYIHRPGTHSLQKDFNPDFIIKKGKKIIIVEIKSEDDSTIKNKDKLEGAVSYLNKLNNKLGRNYLYEFHFLDERDYTNFLNKVIVKGEKFVSKLQATLSSKTREELREGR